MEGLDPPDEKCCPKNVTPSHLEPHDGPPTHQDDQLLLLRVVGDAEGPHCLLEVFVCRLLGTPVHTRRENTEAKVHHVNHFLLFSSMTEGPRPQVFCVLDLSSQCWSSDPF